MAVYLAVDFLIGGEAKNPLPNIGGEDRLGRGQRRPPAAPRKEFLEFLMGIEVQ